MSLIVVAEHTEDDLAAWAVAEERDLAWGRRARMEQLARQSVAEIVAFTSEPCYASTSWGKDSTVLAHLCWIAQEERGVEIPLGWVRVEPAQNPWCHLVRNAFIDRWRPASYHEVPIGQWEGDDGAMHSSGTLERGFKALERATLARRYMSGVRADESTVRAIRVWQQRAGKVMRSCAPLAEWTADDVFGWLAVHDLPVHPVYAMTLGGRLPRESLRVSSVGGQRGTGRGRGEWERRYITQEVS